MDALTFVGYASLSIDGGSVCPNALIGRIIAGDDEDFQALSWFTSSIVSDDAMIFGWPTPNNFGGNEPKINQTHNLLFIV